MRARDILALIGLVVVISKAPRVTVSLAERLARVFR